MSGGFEKVYPLTRHKIIVSMGKTYRKDKTFRPKGRDKTFGKDPQPWKRPERPKDSDKQPSKFDP